MEILFYDPNEDDEGLGKAAWKLASESGINVLSDKDLKVIALGGNELVGAMFDSLIGGRYSFDIVVSPSERGHGIGSALIDAALDEFKSVRDAGAEMVLDVVNPDIVPVLEKRGLSVLDVDGNHMIMGYEKSGSIDLASAANQVVLDAYPELTPGYGFHLEGDGHWDIQKLPSEVLERAVFSGYLKILGYESAVFEMPDGDQWAQKQSGTPEPKGDEATRELMASRSSNTELKQPWNLHAAALRVASRTSKIKLEPGMQRSLQAMAEEMAAAEVALDKAVQYGRRLEVEPSFDWILEHVKSVLDDFREFRKSAQDAIAYALPEE